MRTKHSRRTFRMRQDEMLQQLRNDILGGQLPEGTFLPSEKTLSEQFGLSNVSVRSVLEILVQEQLIEKRPRVGNVVMKRREQQRTVIKIGHHGSTLHEAELRELLELFHAEYPHIQVQEITLPGSSPDVVRPYLDYGMIDVMTLNDCEFQDFVERGYAGDLTPLNPQSEMYPFLTRAFTTGTRLLAQPFLFSPAVLCYNRDHFDERGLSEPDSSWTWEDLFETADKLAIEHERFGFYFSAAQRNRCTAMLLQNGAFFEKRPDGRIALCGTPIMDNLRRYKEIMTNRLAPILSDQDASMRAEQLFAQGKVSMILTTYLSMNYLRGSNIAYDIAQLPQRGQPATQLIAIGLAVNKQSTQPEAARLLVDFLTGSKAQTFIRQKTLSLPGLKPAAEWVGTEAFYRPSRFALYREILPTLRYHRELGLTERQWGILHNEALLFWSGFESEESFCGRMEEALSMRD
jgi:multiple sugar transport system substrate-binding protein